MVQSKGFALREERRDCVLSIIAWATIFQDYFKLGYVNKIFNEQDINYSLRMQFHNVRS